jgi:hypothetical protein
LLLLLRSFALLATASQQIHAQQVDAPDPAATQALSHLDYRWGRGEAIVS